MEKEIMERDYQCCNYCIMDTSDPTIRFNKKGRCNYCWEAEKQLKNTGYRGEDSDKYLQSMINEIKIVQKNKPYDCIIGISGGVDSAYLLYLAKEVWNLHILAVHVDAGWNTDMAVNNIQKLCEKLDIDLKTIDVDWNVMKEIQRAYMFSGLPNVDVPQDHAFFAALYETAHKFRIKYVLTGGNAATESIMPPGLVYNAMDYKCLKDVCRQNGRKKIKFRKYPHMTYLTYRSYLKNLKILRPLNEIPYTKTEAMEILKNKFNWEYYGGKHWESRFTKFIQNVYLPNKFGFNKSRAHLSNLIVNKEITREEALELISKEKELYPDSEKEKDKKYILRKLDMTEADWNKILNMPNKSEDDYKNDKARQALLARIKLYWKIMCRKKEEKYTE